MRGSHGHRRRTREIKVELRDQGKVKIRKRLQKFSENESVALSIDPSYQSIPYSRFRGCTGKVIGKQGRAYYVEVKTGGKMKKILLTPEHMVKIG